MPTPTKLSLPKGYGTAKEVLAWAGVRARLEEAKAYWLATAAPTVCRTWCPSTAYGWTTSGTTTGDPTPRTATAYADVFALSPNMVLAWMAFPLDATRFDLDE